MIIFVTACHFKLYIYINYTSNHLFTSISQSCSTLRPHGLQQARLPCPSPTPGVYSNSCTSHWWCRTIIASSVEEDPLPIFNLSQHQDLFQWVSSLGKIAKVLEFQLQHQFFQWIFRTNFLQDWLVESPCSPRNFQESSPTPQFKSISSSVLSFFIVQLSHPYMTTGKTIALTRWTFVDKVMSLFFICCLSWS